MTQVIYDAGVEKLLTLDWSRDDWRHEPGRYAKLGLSVADKSELLRMLSDSRLLDPNCSAPECCGPMHALAALGELQIAEALGPALELVDELPDEDWPGEILLSTFPGCGGELIGPAAGWLRDPARGDSSRAVAAELLGRIGMNFPDLRTECVAHLASVLELAQQSRQVNTMVVVALLELKAAEASKVIRRIFDLKLVDEFFCGDWPHVEYELGLTDRPPPPSRRQSIWQLTPGEGLAYDLTPDERAELKRRRKKEAEAAAREKKKAKLAKKQKKRNR